MTLSTSLKAELSQRMAEWYEKEMGMRPSGVRIASEGEMVFVRFKDVLCPSEINLSTQKAGRELIREVNDRLCRQAFPKVKEIVSALTGLELLDLQVEVNMPLHEKIYILTLDRPLQKRPEVSTTTEKALLETQMDGLGPVKRGKVRDIYDLGEHLLIVTTDRVSAFDVVLPSGIPGKGRVLTGLSEFWFRKMEDLVFHHLVSTDVADFPEVCQPYRDQLEGRSMLVKKAAPLPVECIVRVYLSGSGWKEYCATGTVCGLTLPEGLKESERLPEPIFTPSTKAHGGAHDLNITFEALEEMVGAQIAHQVKALSLAIYCMARTFAEEKGIIIADTKLEFGTINGKLIVIDELLTPDSSRFWPVDGYSPGRAQKSMDKQFVRDYLTSINWDKKGKAPELPPEIVDRTRDIYLRIFHILTSSGRERDA